ncbi:hypothetical protein [Psychroflexus tropicus]|uniref:hypothetical protein n=1 Tax=Psychroflexus tropicus TaxID=197345 RepID=UPI0012F9B8D3|nr:hypothetical protein [Psychroflexus tropicus]
MDRTEGLFQNTLIDKEYEYLDEEFKIEISEEDFDRIKVSHLENGGETKDYVDSLIVILNYELNQEFLAVNKALLQITYSWDRVGYHIWKSAEESKDLAAQAGFFHPWRFQKYIESDLEGDVKHDIIEELRYGLEQKLDLFLKDANNEELTKLGFLHSERRAQKLKEMGLEHHPPLQLKN